MVNTHRASASRPERCLLAAEGKPAMIVAFLSVLSFIAATYVFSPFLLWKSFFVVARCVVFSPEISGAQRWSLVRHLAKEMLAAPFFTILWSIDNLLYPQYRRVALRRPIFIMSQPRSGTTFLLRTLSLDEDNFFSLKHLEWRFPFIAVWRLIDRLGLRHRIEGIDYWPNTELGRFASKIHNHQLGSVEEHGIFFEERMYHHYFTFRRFPFPEVLERVRNITALSEREKRKLVRTFRQVVQKVALYRGEGRTWLTKENESVDLYRLLKSEFSDAHFIIIVREPTDFISSYVTMSHTCTIAKHGVDPHKISGWKAANMSFRIAECEKLISYSTDLAKTARVTFITFRDFTTHIKKTVERIYADLRTPLSHAFASRLMEMQVQQDQRDAGYVNAPHLVEGLENFDRFVKAVAGEWKQSKALSSGWERGSS
jgi:hypothetical protein